MNSSAQTQFQITRSEHPVTPEQRTAILDNPGFGKYFSDHMAAIDWSVDQGWHDARIIPYGPLQLDPAASVLHYAQEIFEGLKAYRHADGSIWAFRPEMNAVRFQMSARRLALPELPEDLFVESIKQLIRTDAGWVPHQPDTCAYIRPFMISNESFLGVRAAQRAAYYVIVSPAASYFGNGMKPVSIWLSDDYSRAGKGGTGAAKCGGNYAASLVPQQEATANGCSQVLFLDAEEHKYLEELGGMNIFLVQKDGTLITPKLTGSILNGVTRASIIQLAHDMGLNVEERRIALDEWRDGIASGNITEVFACGTAAVVAPVNMLKGKNFTAGDINAPAGEITLALYKKLTDIQYGRAPDTHGWTVQLA